MEKYKRLGILVLAAVFLCLFMVGNVSATDGTTFPVDEAGIAAYVKVDNIENIDIDALAEAYHTIEASGENYVIGTVKVTNELGDNYPHLYVGLDGWMVAYYLNTEEASRIMQWKGYTAGSINTTTLKDAIDYMSEKTGVTYSMPVKYYDFEFPEANKMTIITETNTGNDDFYVTVPGTLYEASYQVLLMERCGGGSGFHRLSLNVDGTVVFEVLGGGGYRYWLPFSSYGYYNLSIFETGITHHVSFVGGGDSYSGCQGSRKGYTTVLIYKN